MMDDRVVIQRVLSGEPEAFAELVRAHQVRVLRLCVSLLGDVTLAEDAAQEIFFKAYQALSSFRGQSTFSTWLYRIAANRCLDLLRKRRREPVESWDALIEASGEPLHEARSAQQDPKASIANTELLQHALAQLSPAYRLLLTLRELEGLSYQELAVTFHCSLDAVRARLRRARQALLAGCGKSHERSYS